MSSFQRTLKKATSFEGIGLHSGAVVEVTLRPAPANTGIVFERSDLPGRPHFRGEATRVFDTTLATRIGSPEVSLSTVEHLMAALWGFGIDNAWVSVNGPEMPIMDGSSAPFLVILDEAGVQELKTPRRYLRVTKTIEVLCPKGSDRFIRIEPSNTPLISYAIDFGNTPIGQQSLTVDYTGRAFCEENAVARTFCFHDEVEYMKSKGLARGGSLDNAIVVNRKEGLVNGHGLRTDLEFVRHKILDCVGDLALVGAPVLGHVFVYKGGHDLHTLLAKAILTQKGCVEEVIAPNPAEGRRWSQLLPFPASLAEVRRSLARSALATG